MNAYERVALWSYILSVAFSVFGPTVHYTGWSLCLMALIANRLFAKGPFLPSWWGTFPIFHLLTALFLWGAFCLSLGTPGFYAWGKEASVLLEILLGLFFAVRLLNSESRRCLFARVLVGATAIALIHSLLMYFNLLPPVNHTLQNGNVLGFFALFAAVPLSCYALWSEKRPAVAFLLLLLPLVVLALSFSSGAWAGAAAEAGLILFYSVKYRKLSPKMFLAVGLIGIIFFVVADRANQGRLFARFREEISNLAAIDDMDRFTNVRNKIWEQAWVGIKEHPLLGHGEPFGDFSARLVEKRGEGLVHRSPHTTYLYLLYICGIPGLALFCGAVALTLRKCFKLIPVELKACENSPGMVWSLVLASLILGQIVYSISGDIFQARRDLAVPFWALWGLVIALKPQSSEVAK